MRQTRDDFEAIVLTGYGDESTAIQALRNGAMSFIRKAVDLDELLVTMQKAGEKLSLERALRYRTREVDLARRIIAQTSEHGEIVIKVAEPSLERAKGRITQALDHLSDAVAVLDEELLVASVNARMKGILQAVPTRFDGTQWTALADASHGELSAVQIHNRVLGVLSGPVGGLETVGCTNGFGLLCAKARARSTTEARDHIVLLASGLGG